MTALSQAPRAEGQGNSPGLGEGLATLRGREGMKTRLGGKRPGPQFFSPAGAGPQHMPDMEKEQSLNCPVTASEPKPSFERRHLHSNPIDFQPRAGVPNKTRDS